MNATLAFRTDAADYRWLNEVLAIMEGVFEESWPCPLERVPAARGLSLRQQLSEAYDTSTNPAPYATRRPAAKRHVAES